MNDIISEIKHFLKTEWRVFIMFFICLVFVFTTKTGNILEILIVFLFHFVWDVFMMAMWKCYSNREIRKWSIFQFLWMIIITFIWFYSWFFNWKWNYVVAQVWFTYSAISNYLLNVKKYKVNFLDWRGLLIILFFTSFFYYYFWFITSFWICIQFLGFIFLPLWLILNNDTYRYFVSLLWIFIMTLWSIIILYESYLKWNFVWVDISFTILPLTVLISYLGKVKTFIRLV